MTTPVTTPALPPLVDALLSQRLARYRNPLEERAADISDPADLPGAAHLAQRLAEARARSRTVWIEPE